MKKLIILSLIITSLFVISCKGSGGGDSGSSTTTTPATTPAASLEGTWKQTESLGPTSSMSQILTFTGSEMSFSTVAIDTAPSDPSDPSSMTITLVGPFRLEGVNIYATMNTGTGSVVTAAGTTNLASISEIEAFLTTAGGSPFSVPVNTEFFVGAYAINGNTLTLSHPSDPSSVPIQFTKQ
ncbi:MAG: hypothetical protein PUF61_12220 [Spirochaetales bacterium]|nr:hypothetical protein [Spirochaetales bacterium]